MKMLKAQVKLSQRFMVVHLSSGTSCNQEYFLSSLVLIH